MKGAPLSLAAAVVVAMAAIASAQKPDFSGKWTVDEKATGAAATNPVTLTVKQTAETLKVEAENQDGAKQTRTYNLDGTESVNSRGRSGQTVDMRSTVKWDGDKLVITQKAAGAERTVTWSMAAGMLTIESLESGVGAARKQVYRKVS